jgi:hypothetical protein
VVTDGEQRRLSFQSQLPEAVEGFGEWDLDAFLWGEWFGDEGVGDWSRVAASAAIFDVRGGVPSADEPALISEVIRTVDDSMLNCFFSMSMV